MIDNKDVRHTDNIANVFQYLAMKGFLGSEYSEDTLRFYKAAQDVIDNTQRKLGTPTNVLPSKTPSYDELIASEERNTSLNLSRADWKEYCDQHPDDKVADSCYSAAVATYYKQGNCGEFADVSIVEASHKMPDSTSYLAYMVGDGVDHHWDEAGHENGENIVIDSWNVRQSFPINSDDYHPKYNKNIVYSIFPGNASEIKSNYSDVVLDMLKKNRKGSIQSKARDYIIKEQMDGVREYYLHDPDDAKKSMLEGTYTKDSMYLLDPELDVKVDSKVESIKIEAASATGALSKADISSTSAKFTNKHFEIMHQVRSAGFVERFANLERRSSSISERILAANEKTEPRSLMSV